MTLYGSRYVDDREPVAGEEIEVDGMTSPAVLNEDGIYFFGSDGKKVEIICVEVLTKLACAFSYCVRQEIEMLHYIVCGPIIPT